MGTATKKLPPDSPGYQVGCTDGGAGPSAPMMAPILSNASDTETQENSASAVGKFVAVAFGPRTFYIAQVTDYDASTNFIEMEYMQSTSRNQYSWSEEPKSWEPAMLILYQFQHGPIPISSSRGALFNFSEYDLAESAFNRYKSLRNVRK